MSSGHPERIFLLRYASRNFTSHSGSFLRSSSSRSSSSIARSDLSITVLHDSEESASSALLFYSFIEFPQTLQRAYFEDCIRLLVMKPGLEPGSRHLIEISTKSFD